MSSLFQQGRSGRANTSVMEAPPGGVIPLGRGREGPNTTLAKWRRIKKKRRNRWADAGVPTES